MSNIDKYLITSDIHGDIDILEDIINKWEELGTGNYKLIILGDYVDRGEDSKKVLDTLIELKNNHKDRSNLILLSGNHDSLMKSTLFDGEPNWWVKQNGSLETLRSFGVSDDSSNTLYNILENIFECEALIEETENLEDKEDYLKNKNNYKDLIYRYNIIRGNILLEIGDYNKYNDFISSLVGYYADDNVILFHAGMDFCLEDYRNTEKEYREWARELFFYNSRVLDNAPLDKLIAFGHTPTKYLGEDNFNPIKIRDNIIAIDGGSFITGTQNLLIYKAKDKDLNIIKVGKSKEAYNGGK